MLIILYKELIIEVFTIKEYKAYLEKYTKCSNGVQEKSVEYKIEEINNPHDKIFRKLLEDKKEAIQIINSQLEHKKLKAEDIEHYNSSFISNTLKNSEADIVYKIKNKDVYFLIEHQTYIDYTMPYRILCYEKEIMEAAIKDKERETEGKLNLNNKNFRYPLIISIVLYTGHEKWNPKLDLRNVQIKYDKYEGKEFSRYNLYDINTISNEEFLENKTPMNNMFLIEKSKDEKQLERIVSKIVEKGLEDEEKKFLSTTIKAIFGKYISEEVKKRILKKLKGDDKGMLAVVDMLDRRFAEVEKEGWEKGIKRGLEEGKEKGMKEGIKEGVKTKAKDIAKKLKAESIDISIISKTTGLSIKEIQKL